MASQRSGRGHFAHKPQAMMPRWDDPRGVRADVAGDADAISGVPTAKSPYADATAAVMEPRQLRDQPFRIYRVVPELDKVTAYARHIFYDLMDNMVKTFSPRDTTTGQIVIDRLSAACLSEHDFTFYSDLSTTAKEVTFENLNPVDCLLGDGGMKHYHNQKCNA